MNFGFSYVGLINLLMLFVPNGFWAKYRPEDYDEAAKNEKLIMAVLEKIGQELTTTVVLVFFYSDSWHRSHWNSFRSLQRIKININTLFNFS